MAFFCRQCGHRGVGPGTCPRHGQPLESSPFGSMLGEAIGNYTVVGELGSGGMGVVYRAIHPILGTQVAIKVLRANCAKDPTASARLLREAQVVNRIESEGLSKVTDAGLLPDRRPYVVMELLHGESLAQRLERSARPPLADACRIMLETLEVVDAAHQATVVHRDLKPANIFLTTAGRTVVLDFGIAKLLEPGNEAGLTSTGSALGTPAYMAPEQIKGGAIDARTDVYAAGVVLYELIAGRWPFLGSDFEILSAHIDRRPAPPRAWFPEISVDLQSITLAALAKDPTHRFQTARAMRTALAHVAAQIRS